MNAVILDNITKHYGKEKTVAVDHVSFEVTSGSLFGLIGPDGAGKTSIFRVLTTLLLPDDGTATVAGMDVVRDYREIRSSVGYMPGRFSLYQDLTVEENLRFFATVFGASIRQNYDLIRDIYVQLEPFKDRRAGKLSGGMKQKLALCCALIHKPKVLFLDEPTTGVDPVSRKEFWEMLRRLREQGITILVSTPYMDEATRCDEIALIQNGKILSINTPAQMVDSFPEKLFALNAQNTYRLLKAMERYEGVERCYAFGDHLHVVFATAAADPEKVLAYCNANGLPEVQMKEVTPVIEDCFIRYLSN